MQPRNLVSDEEGATRCGNARRHIEGAGRLYGVGGGRVSVDGHIDGNGTPGYHSHYGTVEIGDSRGVCSECKYGGGLKFRAARGVLETGGLKIRRGAVKARWVKN